MTVSSRGRAARPHEPLIAGMTPGERAGPTADLLAANLMDAIEAACTQSAPERVEVSAAPSGRSPDEDLSVMGPDQDAAYRPIGMKRRNRAHAQ